MATTKKDVTKYNDKKIGSMNKSQQKNVGNLYAQAMTDANMAICRDIERARKANKKK